jgi:enoyl-CoA hydratase/carnithine racemase
MANGVLSFEVEETVGNVTINRAAARNGVNRETADMLASAFRRIDAYASLRVAVLTGTRGYCARPGVRTRRAYRPSSGCRRKPADSETRIGFRLDETIGASARDPLP